MSETLGRKFLKVKLEGFEDVRKTLKRMPNDVFRRKALIKILRNAMKPVIGAAKTNLAGRGVKTGTMKESIGVFTYRGKGDVVMVGVGPRLRNSKFKDVAKYVIPVHSGSVNISKGIHFMDKAETQALGLAEKKLEVDSVKMLKKYIKSKTKFSFF